MGAYNAHKNSKSLRADLYNYHQDTASVFDLNKRLNLHKCKISYAKYGHEREN